VTGDAPLAGIRVVELAQLIAGPEAAMLLGDLGAEVIKIESFAGDPGRELRSAAFADRDVSATFLAYNRNKRSIALDLKSADGLAIARRLIERADVVIENFRPGAMDRLGLGADELRRRDPRLVYASLTGFGFTGPERDRRGVDMVVQAESGLMSITGEPGGRPLKTGFTMVDAVAGHVLAQAILAALFRRERAGVGERITISLLDVALQLQSAPFGEFFETGALPQRVGNSAPMTSPADLMRTRDGEVVISAYLDDHWAILCECLGEPALAVDPRFATKVDRVRNRDELLAIIEAKLSARDNDEWVELLQSRGLVVGVVKTYRDVAASAQVHANGIVLELEEHGRTIRTFRTPYSFAGTALPVQATAPPAIGEHSRAVLSELGYEPAAIDALTAAGVIARPVEPKG
jgi:crotonobetainyl-CoA:carnitine CoA-transferase CaiB-like acyl-CoA transferase